MVSIKHWRFLFVLLNFNGVFSFTGNKIVFSASILKSCNPFYKEFNDMFCYINNGSPIGSFPDPERPLNIYKGVFPDISNLQTTINYQFSNTRFYVSHGVSSPVVSGYWYEFINVKNSGDNWVFQVYFGGNGSLDWGVTAPTP